MAAHFQTLWTPEYGREYVDTHPLSKLTLEDIEIIAQGHQAAEIRNAHRANKLLFCDTDLLTTTVWSNHLFGECPAWVEEAARAAHYDLTLLLAPDVEWIADPQRIGGEFSLEFYQQLKDKLNDYGRKFVEISGAYAARRQHALAAVTQR